MPKDHHHQHHHGSMPKDHHHHHHHHGSMPKDHHHHHGSMPKDHHHANFHKAPPSHGFPHAHSHHSIPIPTFLLPYLQNEAMVFHTCAIILATIPITFTYLFPSNLPWLLNQLLTAIFIFLCAMY
ncbi:hypothetical protein HMI55_001430 [Coelomomyces lativittatus]|nr:hypothetical protein HMI55_001430 [Coelomomyces lativittatus]